MSAVWGVDTGLKRTTLCGLPGPVFSRVATDPKKEGDIATRLALLRKRVILAAGMLALEVQPEAVFIEQPVGSFPNPQLDWACGVVTMALVEACVSLYREAPPIVHVPIPTWKLEACGRGNATKPAVLEWARAESGVELDQDDADSFGVATYGETRVPA